VVLLLEIWLEYRADIVRLSQTSHGLARIIYKALTLGSDNLSPESRAIDDKVGYTVTVIGVPSAFLLHGYVGFIFGSIKANPWWSTPLMPVVFLFSAMVSGIAAVLLLYMAAIKVKKTPIDMRCLDTIAKYLFYTFLIDFTLEMLDLVHRTYEADESFRSLDFMVHTRLWWSHVVLQIVVGTLVPLIMLAATQLFRFTALTRRTLYLCACSITLIGIFAMRWNIVIGGQLFSKSFLGYTSYKLEFAAREGLLTAIALMLLPFVIFGVLVKLLPPWPEREAGKA
jgi:Ni/Fe-hydrogenase subunit HybB-like protein